MVLYLGTIQRPSSSHHSAVTECKKTRKGLPMWVEDPDVNRERPAEVCQRYDVARLEVFGSLARGDADAGSDLGILVTFKPGALVGLDFISFGRSWMPCSAVPWTCSCAAPLSAPRTSTSAASPSDGRNRSMSELEPRQREPVTRDWTRRPIQAKKPLSWQQCGGRPWAHSLPQPYVRHCSGHRAHDHGPI